MMRPLRFIVLHQLCETDFHIGPPPLLPNTVEGYKHAVGRFCLGSGRADGPIGGHSRHRKISHQELGMLRYVFNFQVLKIQLIKHMELYFLKLSY